MNANIEELVFITVVWGMKKLEFYAAVSFSFTIYSVKQSAASEIISYTPLNATKLMLG